MRASRSISVEGVSTSVTKIFPDDPEKTAVMISFLFSKTEYSITFSPEQVRQMAAALEPRKEVR